MQVRSCGTFYKRIQGSGTRAVVKAVVPGPPTPGPHREDAGKKAREMMARCEGLNLDAKLARLEKRARSAKGVVKVQRGSAR